MKRVKYWRLVASDSNSKPLQRSPEPLTGIPVRFRRLHQRGEDSKGDTFNLTFHVLEGMLQKKVQKHQKQPQLWKSRFWNPEEAWRCSESTFPQSVMVRGAASPAGVGPRPVQHPSGTLDAPLSSSCFLLLIRLIQMLIFITVQFLAPSNTWLKDHGGSMEKRRDSRPSKAEDGREGKESRQTGEQCHSPLCLHTLILQSPNFSVLKSLLS